MNIKQILDEISNEPGKNQKMVILGKYADNELLKRELKFNTDYYRIVDLTQLELEPNEEEKKQEMFEMGM